MTLYVTAAPSQYCPLHEKLSHWSDPSVVPSLHAGAVPDENGDAPASLAGSTATSGGPSAVWMNVTFVKPGGMVPLPVSPGPAAAVTPLRASATMSTPAIVTRSRVRP